MQPEPLNMSLSHQHRKLGMEAVRRIFSQELHKKCHPEMTTRPKYPQNLLSLEAYTEGGESPGNSNPGFESTVPKPTTLEPRALHLHDTGSLKTSGMSPWPSSGGRV